MAEEPADGAPTRWTCDACGCNTNTVEANPSTCSICGSRRRSMPELLQRAERSLSAHLLGRGLFGQRGRMMMGLEEAFEMGAAPPDDVFDVMELGSNATGNGNNNRSSGGPASNNNMSDDDDDDDDDDGERAPVPPNADDQSIIAAIALEAAGSRDGRVPRGSRMRRLIRSASQRASQQGSSANRRDRPTSSSWSSSTGAAHSNPEELLRQATENGGHYQPVWVNMASRAPSPSSRGAHEGVPMKYGTGEYRNAVMVPMGSMEGRPVRANEPMPRTAPGYSSSPPLPEGRRSPRRLASPTSGTTQSNQQRAVYGFKVAFSRPNMSEGNYLGGQYLVGVTTSAFNSYHSQNGLSQSSLFWGIEDSGHKYEGPSGAMMARPLATSRRSGDGGTEAPSRSRNDAILYGCNDVLTVVLDMEHCSMSFWRNDRFLGTLVHGLPRSGHIYPVVVPFNHQSSVAITGMNGDPQICTRNFQTYLELQEKEKKRIMRAELDRQRQLLIHDGQASPALIGAIRRIIAMYSGQDGENLDQVSAARLWYRSGMKLSHLEKLLTAGSGDSNGECKADDFLQIIHELVKEDCEEVARQYLDEEEEPESEEKKKAFAVGDIVELTKGYEQYGDALKGPMVIGDRGRVVDTQNGHSGERQSIRVLYNGRRWWYQPQALVSERSGLVATPTVWFLRKLLRAHGYNPDTMRSFNGLPVTKDSWQTGDFVVPLNSKIMEPLNGCFGRLVTQSPNGQSRITPAEREKGHVLVETVSKDFATKLGHSVDSTSSNGEPVHRIWKVKVSKLRHVCDPVILCARKEDNDREGFSHGQTTSQLSSQFKDHVDGVAKLRVNSINILSNECCRNTGIMLSLLENGMADAMLTGLEYKPEKGEQPNKVKAVEALGKLACVISREAFDSGLTSGAASSPQNRDSELAIQENASHLSSESIDRNELDMQPLEMLGDDMSSRGDYLMALLTARSRIGDSSLVARAMGLERARSDPSGAPLHPLDMRGAPLSSFLAPTTNRSLMSRREALTRMSEALNAGRIRNANTSRGGNGPPQDNTESVDTVMRNAEVSMRYPLLNNIRRGGFSNDAPSPDYRGTLVHSWVRTTIQNGLLTDSFEWVDLALDVGWKRRLSSSSSGANISLLNPHDEEKTPLCMLAIRFGCSHQIIAKIVELGASVGNTELKTAAYTDQPRVLLELLRNADLSMDALNLEQCTDRVKEVIDLARVAQNRRRERIRMLGENLIEEFIIKLVEVGIASRVMDGKGSPCFSSICRVLVGPVQNEIMSANQQRLKRTLDPPDSSVDESMSTDEVVHSNDAIFGLIPTHVIKRMTGVNDVCDEKISAWIRFIEGCLWSRHVNEISFGLSILLSLLQGEPRLAQHDCMKRYAIPELIASHQRLAEVAVSTIQSQRSAKMSVRYNRSEGPSGFSVKCMRIIESGAICCPKLHVAELHVTKHSSFRCDLCGKGVDCGRSMYGCRQCDWDACESCMDREEVAVVTWRHVNAIGAACAIILQDSANPAPESMRTKLTTRIDMKGIATAIRRCDTSVVNDLARLISQPFLLSMYDFSTMILPALYDAAQSTPTSLPRIQQPRGLKRARMSSDLDIVLTAPLLPSYSKDEFFRELVKVLGDSPQNLISGLVFRLQEVITFLEERRPHESEAASGEMGRESRESSTLQRLVSPLDLELVYTGTIRNEAGGASETRPKSFVQAEPLMAMSDLKRHLIRSVRFSDEAYEEYSRGLVDSVILDRRVDRSNGHVQNWEIALVSRYDENSGAHVLRYATDCGELNADGAIRFDRITFSSEEKMIVVGSRDFIVLRRDLGIGKKATHDDEFMVDDVTSHQADGLQRLGLGVGSRVECKAVSSDGTWQACTIVARRELGDGSSRHYRYDIATDGGQVFPNVSSVDVRFAENRNDNMGREAAIMQMMRRHRDLDRSRMRAMLQRETSSTQTAPPPRSDVLKRTWSALSILDELKPIDLKIQSERKGMDEGSCYKCSIGDSVGMVSFEGAYPEYPMKLIVEFSSPSGVRSSDFSNGDTTVYAALKQLLEPTRTVRERKQLLFTIESEMTYASRSPRELSVSVHGRAGTQQSVTCLQNRSYHETLFETTSVPKQSDFDPVSVQCMELISLFGQYMGNALDGGNQMESLQSKSLTSKLMAHLVDPLDVVAGGIPKWCLKAPCRAPALFSYEARRSLLEKVAFGISRSVLREQESRVNVSSFRQRMTTLRGRAVELVGEAFSGAAEDPTALQLQAEELYGMEEALAARVRQAFRAQRWQERKLQCAKAAIRRDQLLADAAAIMDSYARDTFVSRRRLEVRFEGESGFDAAVDQAGVTRGFFSDVAEKLLSCEHVSSVYTEVTCQALNEKISAVRIPMTKQEAHPFAIHQSKLPLWIPDVDAGRTLVIPTPRADPTSTLGVFPRPLSPLHPQINDVKRQFRFMGRLFAGAMRDGFMFPLPLSCAFLKLVQQADKLKDSVVSSVAYAASDLYIEDVVRPLHGVSDDVEMEDASFEENSPIGPARIVRESRGVLDQDPDSSAAIGMLSKDLPRPGFLGGEIFAVEGFVCTQLDKLENTTPPLSAEQLQVHREKIGADSSFARVALGKSYDCSFNEYFKDFTFVDPFDPSQGECATPLCDDGHLRSVTVENAREWVALAKDFVLLKGVREQAIAFRQGIEDFFPAKYISLLTPSELQRDVCGGGDNVDNWTEQDIKALFNMKEESGIDEASAAVVSMGGGVGASSLARRFDASSWTMKSLIRSLLKASPLDRRSFLSFVTSVPIARKGMSRIEVVPLVSPSGEFLPMRDPGCLPRANTCACRLYLPKFESFEVFEQVLWSVVRQECKFKGFYEWRG